MKLNIEDEVIIDFDRGDDDLITFFEDSSNLEGYAIIEDIDGAYIWIEGYDVGIPREYVVINVTTGEE